MPDDGGFVGTGETGEQDIIPAPWEELGFFL